MRPLIILSALTLATAACGGGTSEDRQTTETRMDDLDSLEGTISDDAINTDESTDEAPLEAAPAPTEQPKAKLDKEQAKETGGPDIVKIEPEEPAE